MKKSTLSKSVHDLIEQAKQSINHVASGQFGALMQIHLVNDGPVTILIDSAQKK